MAKLYFNPDGGFSSCDTGPLAPTVAGVTAVDFDPSTNAALLAYAQSGHQQRLTYTAGTVLFDGEAVTVNAPSVAFMAIQSAISYLPQLLGGTALSDQQRMNLDIAGILAITEVLGAE